MPEEIRFVIITGLSGAGKTEAARAFEDLGYFVVDNLPPTLIPKFAELCAQSGGKINKIALVIDIRGGEFFDSLFSALESLEATGFRYDILFLEADDQTLIKRFKETRRRHPLAPEGGLSDAIQRERRKLEGLRGRATKIIDTTSLSAQELRRQILNSFLKLPPRKRLKVKVVSFGYKHGLPLDVDLVLDARFLPNPHYVESLRPLTGEDKEVRDYVMKWPITQQFVAKLKDLMEFLMPNFVTEGKTQLIIGIGCTGGRHRSVTLADLLADFIREMGYSVTVEHRDINK